MLLTLTSMNDISVSIVTNVLKVANADGGFKKELSDRNQAHHSVCGNAGHYIVGASLGTRNKYFSRTFTLPDTLYNSGLLNSTIGVENVAA